MIIACPACRTRYVVPDSAIGVDGRTVRCAKCKHSWHQQGPRLEPGTPPGAPAAEKEKTPHNHAGGAPVVEGESERTTPSHARREPPSEEPAPEKSAPEEHPGVADAPLDARAPSRTEGKDEEADAHERRGSGAQETTGVADARPTLNHWRTDQFAVDSSPETAKTARGHGVGDDGAPAQAGRLGEDAGGDDLPEDPPLSSAPPPLDEEPVADWRQQFEQEEETSEFDSSPFDYAPPFSARRNPLKLWTIAGLIFAVLALATMVAIYRWGLPSWVPIERPVFAMAEPDLELSFPAEKQQRRTLPNGSEYFAANGTITNTGRETARVPSILVVMRDARNRIVYSWEVVPPRSKLAPGETMVIKEAITDIPPSAKYVEIGWKPE